MELQQILSICTEALCTDLKHMFWIAVLLSVTLLLLNLPRVSVWAVDTWHEMRRDEPDRK